MNMDNVTVYDYITHDFDPLTDDIYSLAYVTSRGHLYIRKYSDEARAREDMRLLIAYPQAGNPVHEIRLMRHTIHWDSETLAYIQ